MRTIAVALIVLGGLYWGARVWLKQPDASTAHAATFNVSIPLSPTEAQKHAQTYEAFPVFKVTKGSVVTLVVHSARPGSLHVHGYEKQIDLVQGGSVTLTFPATIEGLFPLHLHGADPEGPMEHVATLEVHPQ